MLSEPDLTHAREALCRLDFLVVQDLFLTETAQMADVVLPAASFAEKDGTFTNTERRIQRVRRALDPPGESRADWEILAGIASRLGYPMHYDSPAEIMEEAAAVTPIYGGIRFERLNERRHSVALPGSWPSRNGHPSYGPLHPGQGPVPCH